MPLRSVTSMSPLGSHARLHGCHRPLAMMVVLTATFAAFLALSLPCGCPCVSMGSRAIAANTARESRTACKERVITRILQSGPTWLKVSRRGASRNNPKMPANMSNAVSQWNTPGIKDLAPGRQRFFPQVPRPIQHGWIGQIGLVSIGSKPSLPRGIVAIDENDASVRNLGSDEGFLNKRNSHLPFKENRPSGAQNRADLFHPSHGHGALPSLARLGRNAN